MPQFFTFQRDVPLAPGQTLAYQKGKGFFAKGAALPYAGYQSPQALLKLAEQSVSDELLPNQQEIERQRAEATKTATDRAQLLQGLYTAAAHLLQGQGPQVAGIYQTGARDQAAFAKGFSDGMAQLSGQSADKTNSFLQNVVHAPEGQMVQPNHQADVTYGLGGYIPASTMEREGAAFGAAAAQQPATAIGRGQMDVAALMRDATAHDKSFEQALQDLEARRPGLVRQALATLQNQEQQKQATGIQGEYLRNSLRSTGATITGFDPATGLPTYGNARDSADRRAAAAAAAAAARQKRANARAGAVGKRADALSSAKQNAFARAREYQGKPEENPKPGFRAQGKFLAQQGRSEFKDGTTNDPNKARRESAYGWQQAFTMIYTEIADGLKNRYGVKDPVVRQFIRERMIAAGWQPPKPKPPPPTSRARNPRAGTGPGERPT